MKQSLESKIKLFAFAVLSMATLANTAMDLTVFRKDYLKEILMRSQGIGISLKTSVEKVIHLGVELHDIHGLSEKCREIILSDQDIRFCAITDTADNLLALNDPLYKDIILNKHENKYILDTTPPITVNLIKSNTGTYYTLTTSLSTVDDKIIGLIHIGFPQSIINNKIEAVVVRSLFVFVLILIVSYSFVILFVKKNIAAPIENLLSSVKQIANGNYQSYVETINVIELNELGKNINVMATTLSERDQELKDNFYELSSTHSKLIESYSKLELLSNDLKQSEELYKKLLEESNDAIIILNQNQHIVIANQEVESLFEKPASSLSNLHISNLLLSLQCNNINKVLKSICDAFNGQQVLEEIVLTTKHNNKIIGRIQGSCITVSGQILLQLIIRNITHEREIILNLENSAKGLARLNKMKDSFIGLASHELKTPLTVIIGYSDLLLSDMSDQFSETSREMIQNISNAASRLDSIIKDMIDVTLIDQKQLELKVTKFDLNSLITYAINELRYFLEKRNQNIQTQFDISLPEYRGDRNRLLQLFINIIGNAIKFTPDYGNISITSQIVRQLHTDMGGVQGNTDEVGSEYVDTIIIVISDTGVGIDTEDQEKIFEKFYEAGNIEEHSSSKVAFMARGAGLGLSIAKGVVEMHGGKIWVTSPGFDPLHHPGSSFFISLPLDR